MKGCRILARTIFAVLLTTSAPSWAAITSSFPAMAAENKGTRTNWVENTVTNLIEIRMSRNRFINEYRTNWIEHVTTNFFEIYKTNRIARHTTNNFLVNAWRTNLVDSFQTNWKIFNLTNDVVLTPVHTNFVESYRTNWKGLTLTNEVAVNCIRTNFVERYQTNFQTQFLTNWQTVIVMKTNWVTQFVTNVAQLHIPKSVSVASPIVQKPAAPAVRAASASDSSDDPVIEVSRTPKPPANGLVEVELKIRWPADTADAPPVQQWKIERVSGSFLSFGQEQEFRRELPVGNYTVEARLQRDADSPSFLLRGTLAVTIKEAIVQQHTDRSKIAAVSDR
jgi:hypothetical protein